MFLDDVEREREEGWAKGVWCGADKTKKTLSKTLSRSKVERQRLATQADDAHKKSYKKLTEQKRKIGTEYLHDMQLIKQGNKAKTKVKQPSIGHVIKPLTRLPHISLGRLSVQLTSLSTDGALRRQ